MVSPRIHTPDILRRLFVLHLAAKKLVILGPASFLTGLFLTDWGVRFVGFRWGVFIGDCPMTLSSTIFTLGGGVPSFSSSLICSTSSIFRFPGDRVSVLISSPKSSSISSSSSRFVGFSLVGDVGFEKKLAMLDLFSALSSGTMNRGEFSPTLPTSFLTG